MTKEQTIAEMRNELCDYFFKKGDCVIDEKPCDMKCELGRGIMKLYEMGYRKVDGENYVSREWHDEQVQHAQNEIEDLKLRLQHAEENSDCIVGGKQRTAKGVVKDFAERLKEYAKAVKASGYDGIGVNDIDQILEEYLK